MPPASTPGQPVTVLRTRPEVPLISLRGVSKSYSVNGVPLEIFRDLQFDVQRRQFVSLIGPSGCGKSTLLKLICGLEIPDRGEVIFDDSPIAHPPRGMIYVFQQYSKSIFPWRTTLQNVEFGLIARGKGGTAAARERCREYINLVGLQGYEHYYPYQLSGGMQQRVAIARALICEPTVLLMDEPFSAVDAMTRAILQELLLGIWERLGLTILFVTHDVDEAVFLSNKVVSLARAPQGIQDVRDIRLAYPRDQVQTRDHPEFIRLRHDLFSSVFVQEKAMAQRGAVVSSLGRPS
jgi:NitT/TauT family transport system ATP-binding protein